jgi:hypothetical protein
MADTNAKTQANVSVLEMEQYSKIAIYLYKNGS